MPGMSGRALFDLVSRERPDLPFLFCGGFSAGSISADILNAPHRALLVKPFSNRELLKKSASSSTRVRIPDGPAHPVPAVTRSPFRGKIRKHR
jgi:hypothetical protein